MRLLCKGPFNGFAAAVRALRDATKRHHSIMAWTAGCYFVIGFVELSNGEKAVLVGLLHLALGALHCIEQTRRPRPAL